MERVLIQREVIIIKLNIIIYLHPDIPNKDNVTKNTDWKETERERRNHVTVQRGLCPPLITLAPVYYANLCDRRTTAAWTALSYCPVRTCAREYCPGYPTTTLCLLSSRLRSRPIPGPGYYKHTRTHTEIVQARPVRQRERQEKSERSRRIDLSGTWWLVTAVCEVMRELFIPRITDVECNLRSIYRSISSTLSRM